MAPVIVPVEEVTSAVVARPERSDVLAKPETALFNWVVVASGETALFN